MTEEHRQVVRIERTFDAPAEDVFDAWTSAEVMRRWFHAGPRLGDAECRGRPPGGRDGPGRDARPDGDAGSARGASTR